MKKILFLICLQIAVFCNLATFGQWKRTNLPETGGIYSLTTDGINIFAATSEGGVYMSPDNDESWIMKNSGLMGNAIYVNKLVLSDTKLYAATSGGLYLSVDMGNSWNYIGLSETSSGNPFFSYAIAVDGANIYMYLSDYEVRGVYFSDNDGLNWTLKNNGISMTDNIWALTANDSDLVAGLYMGGVLLSTDKGLNWNTNTNGIPSNETIEKFVKMDTNILAAGDKVYLSADNGKTWICKNNGIDQPIITDFAFSGNNVFAGSSYYEGMSGSIYMSSDSCENWIDISDGMDEAILSLTILGDYIYAGTIDNGLWKRSLSEIVGINKSVNNNNALDLKISPNPASQFSVISYQLPVKSSVAIKVYDLIGKEVKIFDNVELKIENKGMHSISLNVSELKSGLYFVKLTTDSGSKVTKLIVSH